MGHCQTNHGIALLDALAESLEVLLRYFVLERVAPSFQPGASGMFCASCNAQKFREN